MNDTSTNKPFIKLFKTPKGYYIYSVNKNTVARISEELFRYLNDNKTKLSSEAESEMSGLLSAGYLSSKRVKLIHHPDIDRFEKILEDSVSNLTLQVTQSCNLVCSYCPYANIDNEEKQRNHSNKQMNFVTAKKAIDFLLEHSGGVQDVVISFYGGEPLIAFDLIKKVVDYVETVFLGKTILFNLTTNGTLLTDEMSDFFAENDFNITFSIDGPKKIHDTNRRHVDGTGSFDQAYANMLKLAEKFKISSSTGKIMINMVLDPKNDPEEIFEVFSEPSFPQEILVNGSFYSDIYLDNKLLISNKYSVKMDYMLFLAMLDLYHIIDGLDIPILPRNFILSVDGSNRNLKRGKREIPDISAPGGPCVPGQHKLFVSVNGIFYPCEKVSEVSEAMKIGDIYNGFDMKKIEAMLDIANLTHEKCRNCWAFNLCLICPQFCEKDGKLSAEQRLMNCGAQQKEAKKTIQNYILSQECKSVYRREGY